MSDPASKEYHSPLQLDDKDLALLSLKKKDGSVSVLLGTRETGKSELSWRLAEFFGRVTYAVSPEQVPRPPWITRVRLEEIDDLPSNITLIMDDLPVLASNRDYNSLLVQNLEKIIPMVRHDRKWHLIFCSQSAVQADKYILDCDAAFFKPLGLLIEERPVVAKVYRERVNPAFEGKNEDFIRRHAYMYTRNWSGIIEVNRVD